MILSNYYGLLLHRIGNLATTTAKAILTEDTFAKTSTVVMFCVSYAKVCLNRKRLYSPHSLSASLSLYDTTDNAVILNMCEKLI